MFKCLTQDEAWRRMHHHMYCFGTFRAVDAAIARYTVEDGEQKTGRVHSQRLVYMKTILSP